jgi:hypothetical protein
MASQLRGYSGALVRFGNGAAGQVQLDALGEAARLAGELDRVHHRPHELRSGYRTWLRRPFGTGSFLITESGRYGAIPRTTSTAR